MCEKIASQSWYLFAAAFSSAVAAVASMFIALRQYKLSLLMGRERVLDKRLDIYEAVKDFLTYTLSVDSVSDDSLQQLLRRTRWAYFLFGPEIQKYVHELYDQGRKWNAIDSRLKNQPVGKEREESLNQKDELRSYLEQQRLSELDQKFMKYMDLGDIK
jgi:hypothetical protein